MTDEFKIKRNKKKKKTLPRFTVQVFIIIFIFHSKVENSRDIHVLYMHTAVHQKKKYMYS